MPKPASARVSVETRQYVASHAREPKGRGGWHFELRQDGLLLDIFQVTDRYAEARREAVAYAREIGANTVVVGP